MKKNSLSVPASETLEAAMEASKMYKELAEEIKDLTNLNSGALSTLQILKDSLGEITKPEYYLGYDSTEQEILEKYNITTKTDAVDTSWLHTIDAWNVEKETIAGLDLEQIKGVASEFSELCRLEQEVSQLEKIPDSIISTTAQIASIMETLEEQEQRWIQESQGTLKQLLEDYSQLATKQYEQILKADEEESRWRLGVIEAASKYVDRQVTWSYQLADSVADETTEKAEEDENTTESALPLLPSYIGYSRRIDKSPTEALEESSITSITEKGKAIAEKVIFINKLQLDKGQERVFNLSEKILSGIVDFSSLVCNTTEHLGRLIDALYFTFYENIKHIKILIGQGDEDKGNRMVQEEEVYQCIFDIKTMRSDIRHDLDHGSPNDVRKKMKKVGDCYKKYCGNRPMKPRDYKTLQEKLYDSILEMEEILIDISRTEM